MSISSLKLKDLRSVVSYHQLILAKKKRNKTLGWINMTKIYNYNAEKLDMSHPRHIFIKSVDPLNVTSL